MLFEDFHNAIVDIFDVYPPHCIDVFWKNLRVDLGFERNLNLPPLEYVPSRRNSKICF